MSAGFISWINYGNSLVKTINLSNFSDKALINRRLPTEILFQIFHYLNFKEAVFASLTCRRWLRCIQGLKKLDQARLIYSFFNKPKLRSENKWIMNLNGLPFFIKRIDKYDDDRTEDTIVWERKVTDDIQLMLTRNDILKAVYVPTRRVIGQILPKKDYKLIYIHVDLNLMLLVYASERRGTGLIQQYHLLEKKPERCVLF